MTRSLHLFGTDNREVIIVNPPKEHGMRPYTEGAPRIIRFLTSDGTLVESGVANPNIRNVDGPIKLVEIDPVARATGEVVGELDFERLYNTLVTSGIIRQISHHARVRSGKKRSKDDLMTSDVIALPIDFDPKAPRDANFAVILPGTGRIIGLTDTQMSPLEFQLQKVLMEDAQEHRLDRPNTHRQMGPEIVELCFNGGENQTIAPLIELMTSHIEYSI